VLGLGQGLCPRLINHRFEGTSNVIILKSYFRNILLVKRNAYIQVKTEY